MGVHASARVNPSQVALLQHRYSLASEISTQPTVKIVGMASLRAIAKGQL